MQDKSKAAPPDKSKAVYLPIRLSREAVEKLDLIAERQLCVTRAEAIRRLIADHPWPPNGDEDAPQPDSESEAA
jgi:hypothetical protein